MGESHLLCPLPAAESNRRTCQPQVMTFWDHKGPLPRDVPHEKREGPGPPGGAGSLGWGHQCSSRALNTSTHQCFLPFSPSSSFFSPAGFFLGVSPPPKPNNNA